MMPDQPAENVLSSNLPEPDLGYLLTPTDDVDGLKGLPHPAKLYVVIRATPTKEHFDPVSMHLTILDRVQAPQHVTLGLIPPAAKAISVPMGHITVQDRIHKTVHFFTFGGTLEATSANHSRAPEEDVTTYVLTSNAPILALTDEPRQIDNQLASEIEAILAQARVWANEASADAPSKPTFAQVDPMQAYLGGLIDVFAHYKRIPALAQEFPTFAAFLHRQHTLLTAAGLWTADIRPLSQLLKPDRIPT